MTKQIVDLKAVLENKRAELGRSIRSQSIQLNVGEAEHDLIDHIQGMTRREEAVTFLDALNRTLAAVNSALQAIEGDSYGDCAACGDIISPRRLAAIPWASHCIRCQEKLERRTDKSAAIQHRDEAA